MTRLQALDEAIRILESNHARTRSVGADPCAADRRVPARSQGAGLMDITLRDAARLLACGACVASFWLLLGYCLLSVQP